MIGYESMWFIVNIGSLTFLILSLPLLYLVVPMMSLCTRIKSLKLFRSWLRRNLFYSTPIRLAKESYLVLLIPALINLFYLKFGSPGQSINSLSSILLLVWSIALPALCFVFLKNNRHRVHTDRFLRRKFGSLYSNLKTDPFIETSTIRYSIFFYVRRTLLALTVVMLRWILVGQFFVFVMTSVFQVIFIGIVKPMKDSSHNRREIFNEAMTIMLYYHVFCFTDFVRDPYMRYNLGYTCLFFNLVHLLANLYHITSDSY